MPLDGRYTRLSYAVRVGDRYLVPMPRVCTWSIATWASERGYEQVDPLEIGGPIATIVRHPASRLPSAYRLRLTSGEPYWQPMSFPAFVRGLADCMDIHVRPQWELIAQLPGDVPFVGRYERLDDDWRRLCEWLGVEWSPLPHLHRSEPGEPEWTPELREIVRAHYRRDIEAFGHAY